jgi:hypothetical protein
MLTIEQVRYVEYLGTSQQEVTNPEWKSSAPPWLKAGIVLRYQFIAPGIIKSLNGALVDGSQPYMCSAKPETTLCGA